MAHKEKSWKRAASRPKKLPYDFTGHNGGRSLAEGCTFVGAESGQLEEVVAQELQHNNSKGLFNYQHHNIILIVLTYICIYVS